MQDAQLISQAGQVESLASDGLVSVSTGAGQPQKNMELAKFADSLGSSVPLQQTSEQVSITGLYARTSDGKMVELTKESVASVMSGLMGFDINKQWTTTLINSTVGIKGRYVKIAQIGNYVSSIIELVYSSYGDDKLCSIQIETGGVSAQTRFSSAVSLGNSTFGFKLYSVGNYIYLFVPNSILDGYMSVRANFGNVVLNNREIVDSITNETEIPVFENVFGYNTLAELSSGVAEQMGNPAGYKGDKSNIDANTITSSGLYYLNGGITNALEWSYLMVFSFGSANDVVQINTHNSENVTKIRKCAGGTWSSWQTL